MVIIIIIIIVFQIYLEAVVWSAVEMYYIILGSILNILFFPHCYLLLLAISELLCTLNSVQVYPITWKMNISNGVQNHEVCYIKSAL